MAFREAVAVGQPHRSHVHAELLVDPVAVSERELGATTAAVEDADRPEDAKTERDSRGEVGEARLILARSDLDLNARAFTGQRRRTTRCSTRSLRPAVPTAAVASTPCRRASSTISAIASDGALHRAPSPRRPVCVEPLAEPGDLGTVGDRPATSPSAPRSPTWNLTEFVPTSIDRASPAAETDKFGLEPARRRLTFGRRSQAERRARLAITAAGSSATPRRCVRRLPLRPC